MICKVSWALELKRIICRKEEGLNGKVVEDGEASCHLLHSLMESEFGFFPFQVKFYMQNLFKFIGSG